MKQGKQSFRVTIYSTEKDGAQPIISYMVYLIKVDIGYVSVSAKLKCQILFLGISDATKIDIYHAVTIGNSEKKKFVNSASHLFL